MPPVCAQPEPASPLIAAPPLLPSPPRPPGAVLGDLGFAKMLPHGTTHLDGSKVFGTDVSNCDHPHPMDAGVLFIRQRRHGWSLMSPLRECPGVNGCIQFKT